MWVPHDSVLGGQRMVLDALEVEWQAVVVSLMWVLGPELMSSRRAVSALDCWALSLQPPFSPSEVPWGSKSPSGSVIQYTHWLSFYNTSGGNPNSRTLWSAQHPKRLFESSMMILSSSLTMRSHSFSLQLSKLKGQRLIGPAVGGTEVDWGHLWMAKWSNPVVQSHSPGWNESGIRPHSISSSPGNCVLKFIHELVM